MTTIVAIILAGLFSVLKGIHSENEAIFNKRAILKALGDNLGQKVDDLSDEQVTTIFKDQVQQFSLNMSGEVQENILAEKIDMKKEKKKPEADRTLPLFVFEKEGQKYYIISVRGNGLWDEIWGNIALKSDMNTIAGVSFDHQGETPGLGAEIKDNPTFPSQFKDTKIYDDAGVYRSITVRKGGRKNKIHEVDGISGATVTADGVTEMLIRGIKYYEPYFNKIKKTSKIGMN